jgi:outer membrane protein OmpA-like peptidoglycan-associated protein
MKKLIVTLMISTMAFTGCSTVNENPNTAKGAGIGAAAGGLLGAVIGNQQGNSGKGAAIGAVLGAGLGGVIGQRMDKQAKELEKIAETKRTEQGLVTKLKSDILFDTGKADLKAQAKANLQQMAEIMKKYPENILTIKGYTDSSGSAKTNETLSLQRANAVKSQLTANGISAEVISAVGMGAGNPVGNNATAEGRQQNRRVEIEVTVDESKVPKK